MKKLMKTVSGMVVAMIGMAPIVCHADIIDPYYPLEVFEEALTKLIVIGIVVIAVVVSAVFLIKKIKNKKNKKDSEE